MSKRRWTQYPFRNFPGWNGAIIAVLYIMAVWTLAGLVSGRLLP